MCAGRNADFALADNFFRRELASVEFFVGAAIGAQGRAFQRNARKQTFVARVGKDLGAHHDVSGALRSAALGTSGGRRIGSEFDLAVKQRLGALGIHDEKDEISRLSAQLKSDADAFERVERRGAPFPLVVFAAAASHHASAVAATDPESTLLDRREHDDALRLVKQVLRNVVRDVQNFLKNLTRILHAIDFALVVDGEAETSQDHHGKYQGQKFFHERPLWLDSKKKTVEHVEYLGQGIWMAKRTVRNVTRSYPICCLCWTGCLQLIESTHFCGLANERMTKYVLLL